MVFRIERMRHSRPAGDGVDGLPIRTLNRKNCALFGDIANESVLSPARFPRVV